MQVIHSFRRAFSPISVRGLEIKNRIVRTPHVTHMAGGGIGDQFIAYHAARGEGGVGLTILEAASVHPSSVFTPRMLMSHDDRVIDGYRRLMTAIEPTGMRVFQQLWHGGFHYGSVAGDVPWAPSALPSNTLGVPAHAMSTDQIAELVEAFAAAAARY